MSDDEELGATIKAHCGRCGGPRNCEIKGFHSEGGYEGPDFQWKTKWHLLVCCGCEYPFAQSVSTDSESYNAYSDYAGDYAQEYIETVDMWPAKAKRPLPEWFKHSHIEGTNTSKTALAAALSELYRALDADLLVLSSIGIRTAFDAASEALNIETHLSFDKKLAELVTAGKILSSQKETLEVLIEAGSASAHRGWKPTAKQIGVQMDVLEEFIYNAMVLPAREKKRAEDVAELRDSVPKKVKAKPRNLTGSSLPVKVPENNR